MKSHKHLIVGNWKMNPISIDEARKVISSTKRTSKELKRTEVAICAPFPYLYLIKADAKTKTYAGVQDVFWQPSGSFTGEISSEMARQNGAKFAIIGHSERRNLGETNEIVSKKTNASLSAGLSPIVCVGEKNRDNSGEYLEFLKKQLTESLFGVRKKFLSDLIIAYEPIWAIGKSYLEAMQPSDVYETTLFIRKILAELFGKDWLCGVRVLYGGSVNSENAGFILGGGKVDGLLVGRESLNTEDFPKLLKTVDGVPL